MQVEGIEKGRKKGRFEGTAEMKKKHQHLSWYTNLDPSAKTRLGLKTEELENLRGSTQAHMCACTNKHHYSERQARARTHLYIL